MLQPAYLKGTCWHYMKILCHFRTLVKISVPFPIWTCSWCATCTKTPRFHCEGEHDTRNDSISFSFGINWNPGIVHCSKMSSIWNRISKRWGQRKTPRPVASTLTMDQKKCIECKVLLLDQTDLTIAVPVSSRRYHRKRWRTKTNHKLMLGASCSSLWCNWSMLAHLKSSFASVSLDFQAINLFYQVKSNRFIHFSSALLIYWLIQTAIFLAIFCITATTKSNKRSIQNKTDFAL